MRVLNSVVQGINFKKNRDIQPYLHMVNTSLTRSISQNQLELYSKEDLLKVPRMSNTVFLTALTHYSVNTTHSSKEMLFSLSSYAGMLPRLRHDIQIYF